MKSFTNIESKRSPKGYYVGYSTHGIVWHIKGSTGRWWAYCQRPDLDPVTVISGRTLAEISDKLKGH